MSSNTSNNNQEIKFCAGKDCNNKGSRILAIKYIRRIGYFCDHCAGDIVFLGLAEADTSIDTIMERTKEQKKIGLASESVEGPATNAKGNESFQEGTQNDYQ